MSEVYYSLPGENLLAGITPTLVTGTLTAASSLDTLTDGVPGSALMLEGVDLELTWDLGASLAGLFLFLFHTNLTGGTRDFRAHTTSDFTTPDISTAIPAATLGGRGFYTQPYLDRRALAAKQFVNLKVAGNSAPIRIGEMWLASTERILTGLQHRLRRPRGGDVVTHRSVNSQTMTYQRNTLTQALSGVVLTTRGAGLAVLDAFAEACGWNGLPFPMVFDSDVDQGDFVRWNQTELVPEYNGDLCTVPVSWMVESRGLPWVDPDAA